jgi:hypothetical protein
MMDIDIVVSDLCIAGARAMRRYAEVSGELPCDLPEYLMPTFILDRIGDKIIVTLETGFSKLTEWNKDARQRQNLPPQPDGEVARLLALAEDLGSPRVDMVLYDGDDEGMPKNELRFLTLVEFKRGWPSTSDRSKLLRILPHIDTCPYGLVCGSMGADLIWNQADAQESGDRWFEHPMEPIPGVDDD